jgi:hypothetical protein
MVWLHVEAFVQLSVACQVRVAENVFPQSTFVTVLRTTMVTFVPSLESTADGSSKFHAVPHSSIRLVAQVISGAVVSTTVMVWLQVELFVQLSVACQVLVAS